MNFLVVKLYSFNNKNKNFFFREFQFMVFAPDDNFLSSNQDINQFLV